MKLQVVAAAILRREGRVLLCHRNPSRAHFPDVWDLPGGHVEDDESPSDALARELHEELGIRIDIPRENPWKVFRERGVELNVFLVDHWEGKPWNRASDEHDEIRWVDPAHAGELDLAHPIYQSLMPEAAKHTEA